jgi:hypothetical protein
MHLIWVSNIKYKTIYSIMQAIFNWILELLFGETHDDIYDWEEIN